MKVLIIEPLGFSGIRYYTDQLARALVQRGVNIVLITSRNYEKLAKRPNYCIYTVLGGMNRSMSRVGRGLDYMMSSLKVAEIVCSERPDIVHMQDSLIPVVDVALVWRLRRQGMRVVYTAHDVDRSSMRYTSRLRIALNRAVYQLLYRSVDHLIVHTEAGRTEMIERFGILAERISRVDHGNHGIHLENVSIPQRAEARQQLGIPHENVVALFFGDRRWSKGLDLLINASRYVVAEIPNYTLLIAGEARSEHTIDYGALLQESALTQHSVFVDGYIPSEEVPIYFAAADFVVLPYRKIYQSGVVHLAYCFGKAVIAARYGGLAEVVEPGGTGWFVEDVTNPVELSRQIIYASQHLHEVVRMGTRAKYLAETRFAWNAIAETTCHIYDRLLCRTNQHVSKI